MHVCCLCHIWEGQTHSESISHEDAKEVFSERSKLLAMNENIQIANPRRRKLSENRLLELLHKHLAPKQRGQKYTPCLQPS